GLSARRALRVGGWRTSRNALNVRASSELWRSYSTLWSDGEKPMRFPVLPVKAFAERGLGTYEMTLQGMREVPFGKWRDIDTIDSLRFWALRLHDVGRSRAARKRSSIEAPTYAS